MKISITIKLLASDGKTIIGEGGVTLDNPTMQEAVSEAAIITKRMCESMKAIKDTPEIAPDSGPWTVSDGEWKGRTT